MPPVEPEIAVIIPCHNEEVAIGRVIDAFRAALPVKAHGEALSGVSTSV